MAGPVRRFVSLIALLPARPCLTMATLVRAVLTDQPARPFSKLPFVMVCWRLATAPEGAAWSPNEATTGTTASVATNFLDRACMRFSAGVEAELVSD